MTALAHKEQALVGAVGAAFEATTWAGWMDQFVQRLRRSPRLGVVAQCILLAVPIVVLFGLLVLVNVEAQVSTYLALEILTFVVMLLVLIRQVLTLSDPGNARGATARAQHLDRCAALASWTAPRALESIEGIT